MTKRNFSEINSSAPLRRSPRLAAKAAAPPSSPPSSPPRLPKKRGRPPKRGRGRPQKNASSVTQEIIKRPRGRPSKRPKNDSNNNNNDNTNTNTNTNNNTDNINNYNNNSDHDSNNNNNTDTDNNISHNNDNNNNHDSNNNDNEDGEDLNLVFDDNEERMVVDGNKNEGEENKSGGNSTSLPSRGIFGSGTKYTGSSLMGGFADMILSSQNSNISIFDEQPSQNDKDEENENDKDNVEEEVPFGTVTTTLLQEQEVFTGEENETTQHSVRAKLYCMDERMWKERGIGILRLNYSRNYEKSPRLVMRTENVLKVILNIALFHGMHVERSQEKFVRLFAFEGDLLVHLAIKLSNSNAADDLYEAIMDAIPSAQSQSSHI
ncbi:hypothetical protein Glove_164g58 [Diversispora epigaea]|uniref:RanBD1 domain-containing protein n=1 Tax=Diversispora epigaea TaxID=1348612 RepID=A0A397IXJ1_9GLOM|nr:hypothetical protein Glove_164g58 [Diversispora epigaea]